MREEDLELLITLHDPGDEEQEEDTFNHLQAENTLEYWLGQLFPARGQHDLRAIIDNAPYKVTFGQGDWTCTLARFTGTTNDSMKGMNIEVCTVTHWQNGQIVEQKVFYDLVGMQKQME